MLVRVVFHPLFQIVELLLKEILVVCLLFLVRLELLLQLRSQVLNSTDLVHSSGLQILFQIPRENNDVVLDNEITFKRAF